MTSAGEPPSDEQGAPVDLSKSGDEPFDPYRFGRPDTPPPAEYAPPGYTPDYPTPAAPPPAVPPGYPGAPGPSGPPGYGAYPPMPQQPPQHGPPPYGGYPQQHQGQYPGHYPGQYPGQFPGQPGYGMPPYAQYPGAKQGNGKATTGMVLGIVSIVLCWISIFNAAIIVPGIVFSLTGLNDSKTRATGRGQAIAGLVCVAVGTVLSIILTIVYFHIGHNCAGIEPGTNAYQRCVQDGI